jgi:MFS superfamily sulfate permease-like transporter
MWSLAPALAVIGVWLRARPRVSFIVLALLMELTGFVSLGGGILFALVIEPLLLITLVASLRANREMG